MGILIPLMLINLFLTYKIYRRENPVAVKTKKANPNGVAKRKK